MGGVSRGCGSAYGEGGGYGSGQGERLGSSEGAGAGNGSACGTGNCKFGGHSYQNYFENCAKGFGYATFSGDGY